MDNTRLHTYDRRVTDDMIEGDVKYIYCHVHHIYEIVIMLADAVHTCRRD